LSFGINVKATPEGVEVFNSYGNVPEGTYSITGHQGGDGSSLAVSQYDSSEAPVMVAHASTFVKHPVAGVPAGE
jgi:hypothetical protein